MLRTLWIGLAFCPLLAVTAATRSSGDLELLGSTINLHGRIIDQPCVVAPDSLEQEVDMGVVDVKELYANGAGVQVPFVIRLTDCKIGIFSAAKVTFSGSADPQLAGALAFTAGSARGAGIRLFDASQTALELGTPSHGYTLEEGMEHDLLFYARVEGHPSALSNKNIQPGDYSAVASFIVSYE